MARSSREPRFTSAVPSARRAHLIAKAKQLSDQRAQRQQQETQRLAQLQASLSTGTQPSPASTHSHSSLTHELDPLIAVDDALHSRYLLHTQQLQSKLAEQQDNMHELSAAILRLQHIIEPDHSHTPLVLSPAFYQQENDLLHSHLTLLRQRLQQKEEEVALLSSLMVKKSARVSEVREEASVVLDEMRAVVKRLGADKERREREMREEREQLMSGLREMIDRCVRENEWMRLRLGEEGRVDMERWKETEESRMEEREHDRQRVLQKEREREKEKVAQREREEQLQLQRLKQEREEEDSRRQQEADLHRQKEEDIRKQQEELKQPEPELTSKPPATPHFISRPSAVLTSSSSAVPSPASATRRVHFRHPSASPTVFYEPAPSSAPSSPLPPPLSAASLHSQSHSLPQLAAFRSPMDQYQPFGPLSHPPPSVPYATQQQQQQMHFGWPSHPPSVPSASSDCSEPSTADSADFDSYFGGASEQQPFALHSLPLTSTAAEQQPQQYIEHSQQQHRPQPFTTLYAAEQQAESFNNDPHLQSTHQPAAATSFTTTSAAERESRGAEMRQLPRASAWSSSAAAAGSGNSAAAMHDTSVASSVTVAQPSQPLPSTPSSSSLSDRVMGRIGGWMLGTAGRERVVAPGSGVGSGSGSSSGSTGR